jgi:hypothetical protein
LLSECIIFLPRPPPPPPLQATLMMNKSSSRKYIEKNRIWKKVGRERSDKRIKSREIYTFWAPPTMAEVENVLFFCPVHGWRGWG